MKKKPVLDSVVYWAEDSPHKNEWHVSQIPSSPLDHLWSLWDRVRNIKLVKIEVSGGEVILTFRTRR
jgi:hypothetical protein